MVDEYEKSLDWNTFLDAQRDLAALLQEGGLSVGYPTTRLIYAGTLLRKASSLWLSKCRISLLIYANVILKQCQPNMQMPSLAPDRM